MPNNKNEHKGKQAGELSAEERFRNFFSTSVIDLPEEMTRRDEPAPVEEKPKAGLLGKLFSHDKEETPAPAQPVLEIPTGEILLGADAKPVQPEQEDMALELRTADPVPVMPLQFARTEPVKAAPAERGGLADVALGPPRAPGAGQELPPAAGAGRRVRLHEPLPHHAEGRHAGEEGRLEGQAAPKCWRASASRSAAWGGATALPSRWLASLLSSGSSRSRRKPMQARASGTESIRIRAPSMSAQRARVVSVPTGRARLRPPDVEP